MCRTSFSFLVLLFLALSAAVADETKKTIDLLKDNDMATLARGQGAEVVKTHCSICHSTDYIVRQPHLAKQAWEAEVKKMISVFGAPVSESERKVIVDYLAAHYGAQVEQKSPSKHRRAECVLEP